MRVEYSDASDDDLADIADYIALDDPDRAKTFVGELVAFVDGVATRPLAFRLREEWGRQVRAAPYGNYLVIFETDEKVLTVLRIVNGRRDIAKLLAERLP